MSNDNVDIHLTVDEGVICLVAEVLRLERGESKRDVKGAVGMIKDALLTLGASHE